jgi:glycosyltransferase involved in cell wall biosynthesis
MPAKNTPVRVVHVVWRLSRTGGIQTVVRDLLARHNPATVENHVISIRPWLEEDGLDEFPDTEFHFVGHLGAFRGRHRLRAMWHTANVMRAVRPGIVHAHSGTATLATGALFSAPSARWIVDIYDAPGRGRQSKATDWWEGLLCRNRRAVTVTHSSSVLDEVRTSYRLSAERIEPIPLGVDATELAVPTAPPGEWRAQNNLRDDAVVVLYVARLVPEKNVGLFLDVARAVTSARPGQPIQFVMLGGGSEHRSLQARVASLGLYDIVRLLGPRSRADLINALHGSDLFVSTSNYEGFGLAVAEAMAAGRAVVATGVGGHFDLVDEGRTGLLAPVGDVRGIAGAVGSLVDDAEGRMRMGVAGAEKIREQFAVDTMVSRYERLYQRLARRAPAASK